MHNSTNGISNEMVKNLHSLAHSYQMAKFEETFNSLSHYHKECYRHIAMEKCNILAMCNILNIMEKKRSNCHL